MSFRTTVAQPAPTNGVSQQAAHLASPTTAREMVNGWTDLALGVSKRPPTDIDRKFADQPKLTPQLKKLDYGPSERYSVLWNLSSANRVRIFRDDGNEAGVTISGDATTYMNSGSGLCRLFPVGDYSVIVNPDVATATTSGTSYSLERTRPEYRDLIAYSTTSGNYLKTDTDSVAEKAGYWVYSPGSVTYALTNFLTLTTPWSIANGYWDDATYYPCGFNVAFRRVLLAGFTGAVFTTGTGKITHPTPGGFTAYAAAFRAGDMIQISAGTGFTLDSWHLITAATANDITIVGGPVGSNVDTASNYTSAAYGETNHCRIGIQAEAIINATTMEPAPTSMHDIAAEFQKRIRDTAGLEYATVAWVPQSGGGNFQITGFRGTGGVVYAPTAPDAAKVGGAGNLTAAATPFYSTPLQVFGGTGTASSPWDAPESRWTRTAAPGQSNALLDPATMPVVLIRTAANTFTVGRPTWTPRGVGDSTSNPAPKLVTTGAKIACAIRHRNRVFYFGGPYVMGSELGDDYNFYNTATPDVLDTDPIDRTVAGENNADIRQVAGFRDGLVLFTSAGNQLEMTSGETLTPKSVAVTPTTHASFTDCQPAVASPQLFFASPQGSYSGVREYVFDELKGASQLADTTVIVPAYISGTARNIAISGEQRTLVVLAGERSKLWCYRWFYNNGEKVQSSWSRWEYDAGYSITGLDCLDSTLWMVNENTSIQTVGTGNLSLTLPSHGYADSNPIYFSDSTTTPSVDGTKYVKVTSANVVAIYDDVGLVTPTNITAVPAGGTTATIRWHIGDYFIEKAMLGTQTARTGEAYAVHLDRRLRLVGVHAAGTTTFTLPSTVTDPAGGGQINGLGSTLNKVVVPSGTVYDIASYTTTTVTVTGNLGGVTSTLGRFYTASTSLTRPYVRTDNNAIVQDPLFIESAAFAFAGTTNMSVTESGRTRSTSNTSPTSGVIVTLLNGRADLVAHSVSDSSAGPATLTGIQYDIDHAPVGVVPDRGGR